jgi:hypothetical protein
MAWEAAANCTRTDKLRALIRARTGIGMDVDVDVDRDLD